MLQIVTGRVTVGGGVRLAREAQRPILVTDTKTVSTAGTVLATLTVPAGQTYHLSEVSVGGDTANRIDVVIQGKTVHTMFYPGYGMHNKTYAAMPKAYGGETIQVISRQATAGMHTATIIAHKATELF
ncbi:hypothetical protein EV586_102436 [Tumebacillus sp. BK434]|uniref:hypothetical protein n=1 Tax=Tumebacillus sp. BK434 TaxID=2512169 RepID=UPI00104F57D4|nr:hypothetical protein [Tumebacillus sp. BK434]TCP57988.1 hypothetical protein EV586_102436 [Tumebacillus sp. BK434]